MALAQIMNDTGEGSGHVETRFGKNPRGSYGSYQLSFTESNFQVFCDINSVSIKNMYEEKIDTIVYPSFPITNTADFVGVGVTQAKWCDFIIYTSRIYDHQYWINMKNTLQSYYFDYFITSAITEFSK